MTIRLQNQNRDDGIWFQASALAIQQHHTQNYVRYYHIKSWYHGTIPYISAYYGILHQKTSNFYSWPVVVPNTIIIDLIATKKNNQNVKHPIQLSSSTQALTKHNPSQYHIICFKIMVSRWPQRRINPQSKQRSTDQLDHIVMIHPQLWTQIKLWIQISKHANTSPQEKKSWSIRNVKVMAS